MQDRVLIWGPAFPSSAFFLFLSLSNILAFLFLFFFLEAVVIFVHECGINTEHTLTDAVYVYAKCLYVKYEKDFIVNYFLKVFFYVDYLLFLLP